MFFLFLSQLGDSLWSCGVLKFYCIRTKKSHTFMKMKCAWCYLFCTPKLLQRWYSIQRTKKNGDVEVSFLESVISIFFFIVLRKVIHLIYNFFVVARAKLLWHSAYNIFSWGILCFKNFVSGEKSFCLLKRRKKMSWKWL